MISKKFMMYCQLAIDDNCLPDDDFLNDGLFCMHDRMVKSC